MNIDFFCKNKNFILKYFLLFFIAGLIYLLTKFLFFSNGFLFTYKLLLNFIIISPILEEWTFRGIIQQYLLKSFNKKLFGISLANFLTSFLFSIIHLFYNNPLHSIAVFIPSLIFGITYEKCGKIYLSVFLHSFYNLNVFII